MKSGVKNLIFTALLLGLSACAQAPVTMGTNDPYEATNRAWFNANLALDRAISGRTERALDSTSAPTDDPLHADAAALSANVSTEPSAPRRSSAFRRIVINFGGNLGLPSSILNDLLQIRPDHAAENVLRLAINSTIGLGGLFDPAGSMGIHGRTSDFGETLHRWGVGEGAYVVLPVFGPSTERDAAGIVVDAFLDPLQFVLPRAEYNWSVGARYAARFADRAEYADLLDANVINTADPYAQARLLYLQTRRYHLGIENEQEVIDPYADLYD